jgi:hypothetical protein
MGMATNRAVDILAIFRGDGKQHLPGVKIVKVATSEPAPITFVFEGATEALDLALFEVPVDFYPLRVGDRLLVFPMIGSTNGQRYAVLQKLNGGLVFGTYSGGKITVPNLTKPIEGFKKPRDMTLLDGDQVAVMPYLEGATIKYAIMNKY